MKSSSNLITGGVIAKIRNMILKAELKPGHRLVEEEFTRMLGVGRTPVREALLLLQGEGFVARNQRGWEVRGLRDDHGLQAVFECRAAIEAECARLAARKMTPKAAERLIRLIPRMEPGGYADRLDLHRVNDEFHSLILHSADNELLTQFHERTQMHYWALGTPVLFSDDQARLANQQHRDLLEAMLKGDEEAAERHARAHVHTTQDITEAFIRAVDHYEAISSISNLESRTLGGGRP
jgi:DNA-binding GntR family transcriptional regulator